MVTKKLFNLLTTVFLLGCLAWVLRHVATTTIREAWAQAP